MLIEKDEKRRLRKIITNLESTNYKEEAYFGIFQYGGDSSESFIKANKDGLEFFAIKLLKASRDSELIIEHKEKKIITFNEEEDDWIDGDTFVGYIEPISEKRADVKEEVYKETWQDTAIQYGCFGILIFLLITILIGLSSIVNWLF